MPPMISARRQAVGGDLGPVVVGRVGTVVVRGRVVVDFDPGTVVVVLGDVVVVAPAMVVVVAGTVVVAPVPTG
jgi:hypothetical protein